MPGVVVANQPGVYLVDADGNVVTVADAATIGSAEGVLIAGKDGTVARYVKVTAASRLVTDGSEVTQPISAASLPLPSGASTEATLALIKAKTDNLDVALSTRAVTGLTDTELRATAVPVSQASQPLPTGAATQTTLAALLTELQLKADLTETQPISAASLPLPAGAATQATLATLATETKLEAVRVLLASLDAKDFATQTTLDALLTAFNAEDFATQATLATRLADATFTARVNTLGQKTMANSTPVVVSSDQTVIPVSDNGGSLTTDTPQLPAALVGGRLDENVGAWLGSTAPTVGQKTMTNSVPVTLASNQSALPITLTAANARTGVSTSIVTLGGGTANTINVMRATTYTEPASAAQRSVSSSSASDAAAGTGARTIKITYYDGAGAGPLTETVTLNGTTAVNTVATDIRFIESIEVITAGSGGANVGTITLHGSTAGGGGTVGSIGIGNITTGVGDNTTLWAHHYVPDGYEVELAVFNVSIQSGGSATNGKFLIRYAQPLVTDTAEIEIGGVLLAIGTFERSYDFHPIVAGFARLTAYGIPGVNNATIATAFDWSETPV